MRNPVAYEIVADPGMAIVAAGPGVSVRGAVNVRSMGVFGQLGVVQREEQCKAGVDRWVHAAGGRRRLGENLIVGLIAKAQGVTDSDMAEALADRESAMEERARAVREEAIGSKAQWVKVLGPTPQTLRAHARWLREVSTIAAYRDRWHVTDDGTICGAGDVASSEQRSQRKLVLAAAARAAAICHDAQVTSPAWEPQRDVAPGIDL